MVLQTWIVKIFKISNKVIKLIMKALRNWKKELTAGVKTFTELKINRGIVQGNALSP